MASRGEIRDAFYDRLTGLSGTYDVTDAGGTVIDTVTLEQDDIGLVNPESFESLPTIVYDETYTRVQYNGVGKGPDYINYANDGSVNEEVWREYIEATFTVDVRAANDIEKEPIYEQAHRTFAKLAFGPWDLSTLHSDILDIEVREVQGADTPDAEDVIRGDQLQVVMTFHRDYPYVADNITQVEHNVDADNDGTVDNTYLTT